MRTCLIALVIICLFKLAPSVVDAEEFSTTFETLKIGDRLSDKFVLDHFGVKIVNEPMAWTMWKLKEKIKVQDSGIIILLVGVDNAVGDDEYLYILNEDGVQINNLHIEHSANMDEGCNQFITYDRCSNYVFMVKNSCSWGYDIGKIDTIIYKVTNNGKFQKMDDSYCANIRKYSELSEYPLTEESLSGIDLNEIKKMRNEIFASHGYVFKDSSWKKYFEGKSWYTPKNNAEIHLNEIENKNVELLLKWEKGFSE